jgi:hypothetical protein
VSPKNRKSISESPSELIADKEKLTDLVGRAQDGDKKVLPTLRKVLDEEPKIARIVNLARDVEHSLVKAMSGDDLFCQEAIPRNLSEMRDEIAGENPSALERLLAERIALCWLQLQYYEAIYAQNLSKFTITQSEHHQRRIDKAHRRYLSAMRTLAQIRKLLKGGAITQINIADKQINTTG